MGTGGHRNAEVQGQWRAEGVGSARWWGRVSSVAFPQGQSGGAWAATRIRRARTTGGTRGVVRNVAWWTLGVPGGDGEGGQAPGFRELEQWASSLGPASLAPQLRVTAEGMVPDVQWQGAAPGGLGFSAFPDGEWGCCEGPPGRAPPAGGRWGQELGRADAAC